MTTRGETEYAKQITTLRRKLHDAGYRVALGAMDFAMEYHTGMRKDGKNHEFSHQVFIAFYILSIAPMLLHPEECVAVAFLHDLVEDYREELRGACMPGEAPIDLIERMFGRRIRVAVQLLTKNPDGVKLPDDVYYAGMGTDPIASVVKGLDRAQNIHSMVLTGWSVEKQQAYLDFMFNFVLPMLKDARKRFPEQDAVYQNVKSVLLLQARPIQMLLEARQEAASAPVAGFTA
jgi:(p)ppGpp synthase/HD superfamily hydrolase